MATARTARRSTRARGAARCLHLWLGAALLGSGAAAAAFPTQAVRIVVGAPAGAAPDVMARQVAEAMAAQLGQAVLVENRPGAGGTLATSAVAAAAADGHTLNVSGCSGDAITFGFVSQGRPPLALFKDLTPVGRLMRDHWLVLVPANHPASTLTEFGQQARSTGAPVPFPSIGDGSTPHLQGERLARALAFQPLHVPYKDSPMSDLIAGRLGYAVLPSASAVPLVKAGRLKALAVLSDERLASLPDVPTANQAGLSGHTFNGGLCLWAPSATPAAVLSRLNESLADALRQPSVREKMSSLGADPTPYSLDETARYVRQFAADSERLRADVLGSR